MKVLFIDLDGTLITTRSGDTFPQGVWDMELNMFMFTSIKNYKPNMIHIVTNQGGIEAGFVDRMSFHMKMSYIVTCLRDYTGCGVRYSMCETNDKTNYRRKPNPGMITDAMSMYQVKNDECLMVGDASGLLGQFSDSDYKCAENAGISYLDAEEFIRQNLHKYDKDGH